MFSTTTNMYMGTWTKGRYFDRIAFSAKMQKLHKEECERGGCNNPFQLRERAFLYDWSVVLTSLILFLHCLYNTAHRIVAAMVHYGVSLSSPDLGGSLYVNFVLISVVEYPGNIAAILMI